MPSPDTGGCQCGSVRYSVPKPERIADAVAFLSSDKASFITGQIIRTNGGKTAA